MKAYYGSKISPNMTETPDGFLICHNVPIARCGWYKYLGKELIDKSISEDKRVIKDNQENEILNIYRSPEDVFSIKSIASFQGKIVTDNHPPELLNPENAQRYCKGSVDNVRQSSEEKDLLLADLIVYDKRLIKEILEKEKREVSCGYEFELQKNKDGTYSQINIIGNHVAIVENGRAGDRCRVLDSINNEGGRKMEDKIKIPRKTNNFKDWLAGLGAHMVAKDSTPEEFNDVLDGLVEEKLKSMDEEVQLPQQQTQTVPQEPAKDACDEEPQVSGVEAKLDKLVEVVGTLVQSLSQAQQPKAPEQAIDEDIQKLENGCDEEPNEIIEADDEGDLTEPESGEVSDPEDRPKNPIVGADTLAAIKAKREMISYITDPAQKSKALDSLSKEVAKALNSKSKSSSNGYAGIIKSQKQSALDKAADVYDENKVAGEVANIYANMNPHRKENK